jgi:hypothetical protein
MAKARFIFPGEYDFRLVKPSKGGKGGKKKSTLLAYFNVRDTQLGIEFRDMRLIEGENGVFVGSAFRTYENGKGETKYSNYVQAAWDEDTDARDENGVAYFEGIAEAAYAKYKEETGDSDDDEDDEEEDERPRRSAAKKSARGPVRPKATEEDDEDEDEKPVKRGKRPSVDDDEEEEESHNTKTSGKKKLPF